MKMKKLSALLLTGVMAVSMLAGCGSSDSESSSSGSGSSSDGIESTTITFWHGMNGTMETVLQELTDQFNEENEYGITVELVNQGSYSDLSTKLTAAAASDTLPDIAQAYNNYLLEYLDKVVHLDDFVANDFDDWDDIIESYREENSEFGFISGVPFNKSTYVYFYNKTLYDDLGLSAPTTWDDWMTIGETIMEETGLATVGYDSLSGMIEAYFHQNGVDYISEDGPLFDTDAGLETVTFLMNLYNSGYARLVGEDGYFSTALSNGLIAGYVGSTAGVSYIDTSSGWELGVCALPGNVTQAANQAGTNIVMFAQDENSQKAAWEYMKFITSEEATLTWSMGTGYLPVRYSAYESDTYQEFMETDITAAAAYSQSEYFFTTVTFDGSQEIMNNMDDTLEELIADGADADTAMEALLNVVYDALD